MKIFKRSVVICFFLLFVIAVNAQNNTNVLLRKVYNKMQKAKDYTVDANIKADIPFIRILPVNVKIFYKQPDKFKVESKSIAIVPRQGFDQAARVLEDTNSFLSVKQGEEMIGTKLTGIINIIPLSDTGEVVLGKLWIDMADEVILRSQFTTRSNGTIETEYSYGSMVSYGLPDKMTFSVDIKKFKMPKELTMADNKSNSGTENNEKKDKKGKIFIELNNYQVNKGISDYIFQK